MFRFLNVFNFFKKKNSFNKAFSNIFKKFKSSSEVKKEIEKLLYSSDFSVDFTAKILKNINTSTYEKAKDDLRDFLRDFLNKHETSLTLNNSLNIIMLVGVNGVGKTTFAAKIANLIKKQNKKVMLIAADTFRAAAVEQLEYWASKIGCFFYKKSLNADPGAVVYEGITKAKEENLDLIIIDTGGRLHNKENLMAEILKVKKSAAKAYGKEIENILLVIDSTQGQNVRSQSDVFDKFLKIKGIVLTKFDGSSKGGAIFSVLEKLNLPLFYISTGEKIENIEEFSSDVFLDKLLN